MEMTGNAILITGGASGIGNALAEGLMKKGNHVKICDRNERLLGLVKEKHPQAEVFTCDLASAGQRAALFDWASSGGGINMLINNAGIQRTYNYAAGDAEYFRTGNDEIEIDLAAVIHMCDMFIPCLLRKPEAAVVNVASSLAIVHSAEFPVYCACKAGVHAFTRCIREQLKGSSVKVFEALPPAVDSGLNPEGRAVSPPPDMMAPGEYAAYVIDSIESDKYEIYPALMGKLEKMSLVELYEYFKDPRNPR